MAENKQGGKESPTWWALIFTLFIAFVFLGPYQRHASRLEWSLTIAAVVVFYALYCLAIASWDRRGVGMLTVVGVAALGFMFAPFNEGAALFIIYSTAWIPYVVRDDLLEPDRPFHLGRALRTSSKYIGIILALVILESLVFRIGPVFWGYSIGYSLILGIGNTWAAGKVQVSQRLVKVAERERIARDLHDVLGHSLSVIILKSELAGKLVSRDPERAREEIGDVERIARQAMAEVRRTISGYRTESLATEIERAKATLATAGVALDAQAASVPMSETQETVLALALREAVTNVVRHANAHTCRLNLRQAGDACELEIRDDGRGGVHVEGAGLRGMRERIEALGGSVARDATEGTRLRITLPLSAAPGGRDA